MKRLLIILLMGITLTGCKKEVTTKDLENVNNKIVEYFSSNNEYDNLSYNYVDEENKVVVVGLINNTKEEQERFKKLIVDSNLIKFVTGSKNENN